MTTRTARHATRIRLTPDRAARTVGWTRPGEVYTIHQTKLIAGVFWLELDEGWCVFERRGVMSFRDPAKVI